MPKPMQTLLTIDPKDGYFVRDRTPLVSLVDAERFARESVEDATAKEKPDNSWVHSNDATVWAKKFVETNPVASEDVMLGWFANAIMAGHDEAQRRAEERWKRDEKRCSCPQKEIVKGPDGRTWSPHSCYPNKHGGSSIATPDPEPPTPARGSLFETMVGAIDCVASVYEKGRESRCFKVLVSQAALDQFEVDPPSSFISYRSTIIRARAEIHPTMIGKWRDVEIHLDDSIAPEYFRLVMK